MKRNIQFAAFVFCLLVYGVSYVFAGEVDSDIEFFPIKHATFVIQSKAATIYVDPVGDPEIFDKYSKPDIILITHTHGDHLSIEVVDAVKQPDTLIVCTKDVHTQLKQGKILNNGESTAHMGINIKAIPAYNVTPERLKYHPKGRDNGYIVSMSDKRIYISGDTEDIPEMRSLEDIDYAFVCMNLPYTMTETQAVSAVLTFKPKVVFPYHYRGKGGFSDIDKFKAAVEKEGHTQVEFLKWY